MLFNVQESCTSPSSQDFRPATSTNISPRPSPITAGGRATGQLSIDMLLDEVLLEIFACYVEESEMRDAWHTLACVCRRWRSIAFGSPRRLNLRIFCSEKKRIPLRKNLDSWPLFPISLAFDDHRKWDEDEDNILATLEHHGRVCQISIWDVTNSLWEKALPLMQKPFPTLTDLNLWYEYDFPEAVQPNPDLFLGGSATRLRKFTLARIPFPGLPKLLLSATHLVLLELYDIPDSGYIAPEEMVTCLSTLTKLEFLSLCFDQEDWNSFRPRPEWERRRTSSSTCALLPSLISFTFRGVNEYLEDIVDKVDAPQLHSLSITFFHEPIFDTPRLAQFIGRIRKFKTCNKARLRLGSRHSSLQVLSLPKSTTNASLLLEQEHWDEQPDFQLPPLVQLCTSFFPRALIPTVECLVIVGKNFSRPPEQDGINAGLWRDLLQPFTAVKDLYLFPEIAPRVALVLQELVGENVLELFPVLQNIFLKELSVQPSGLVPEGFEQFVAARQLARHPISVSLV